MKSPPGIACLAVILALSGGCSNAGRESAVPAGDTAGTAGGVLPDTAAPASFVNKVWEVRVSPQVAPGQLYAFLSDGTLVVTAAGQKPALGTWSASDSGLVMVEEGISYRVDVLDLTPDTFRIRMHNPGTPVEITFGPARATVPAPVHGGGGHPAVPAP
jgi:hypothetical protein